MTGDQRQAVSKLLWDLGYRDVDDPQRFIKEQLEKAEKWDKLNSENIITSDGEDIFPVLDYVNILGSKLEAIKKLKPWFTIEIPEPPSVDYGVIDIAALEDFAEEWQELAPIVRDVFQKLNQILEVEG